MICKCINCKNTKGSHQSTPYKEEKDAVIIGDGNRGKIQSIIVVILSVIDFPLKLRHMQLFKGLDSSPPKEDEKEELKESDKTDENLQMNNDLISILQKKVPDLKVSMYQVLGKDLELNNLSHNIQDIEPENTNHNNGFYDILGLSKRNLTM